MSDNLKGALWIMLSAAFATVMSVGIKDLGPGVHSMQITFMRCIVGFIIVVPLVWGRQLREARRSGAPLRFELSKRWPLHLLRGVLATIAINCGYYSITQIPLATVTVLFFTAPFFVTLLAVPLLGEKVGWRRWCATTFGFIGALVTLNPEIGELDPVMIFPFAASLFFAGALIIGKRLSTTEAPSTVLLYTMAVTTVGSFLPALLVWTTPNAEQLAVLLILSIFATGRTYTDVRAYAAGDASFVAPFSYIRLVLMSIAGYVFFAEVPTTAALTGGALIIASSLYIAHREAYHKQPISRPSAGPSPD